MRTDMKKISSETDLDTPEEGSDLPISDITTDKGVEEETPEGIDEGTTKILEASLKAVLEGISIGRGLDFASKRDASSIFGDALEGVLAPLTLSMPGRALERSIKDTSMPYDSNEDINSKAKAMFEDKVISPSLQLYRSNFESFINALEKVPALKNLKPLNDITNISIMAIEFKGRDLSITPFSQKSPSKIIQKQIIPIFREKFDAIASFEQSLKAGAFVSYNELERLYKAISEWRDVLKAFGRDKDNTEGLNSDSKKGGEESTSEESTSEESTSEESTSEDLAIADNIYIEGVRPGQYVDRDPSGRDAYLAINDHGLNSGNTPVIKLYIKGDGADDVNSSGTGERYLAHFIAKKKILLPDDIHLKSLLYNVTRESVSGGSEITIYFRPDSIKEIKGGSTGRVEIMRVSTKYGDIPIFIDDVSEIRALERAASADSTPYYQTVSPGGETVFFTPADLVISGGSVKDSKGNKFKPKKIKGKSLAQRVMSKDFGKVRRKK
jgi:hypothetical protein